MSALQVLHLVAITAGTTSGMFTNHQGCSQETFSLSPLSESVNNDNINFQRSCIFPWRGQLDYTVSEDEDFVDIRWKKLVYSPHCVDISFWLNNQHVALIQKGQQTDSRHADVITLELKNRFDLKVQVTVWKGPEQTCFEASHTLKVDQIDIDLIIGSTIGALVALAFLIICIVFWWRREKNKEEEKNVPMLLRRQELNKEKGEDGVIIKEKEENNKELVKNDENQREENSSTNIYINNSLTGPRVEETNPAHNLVDRVLREQGLGQHIDAKFVDAAAKEMQEAMKMSPAEFEAAAAELEAEARHKREEEEQLRARTEEEKRNRDEIKYLQERLARLRA